MRAVLLCILVWFLPHAASAQENFWIQVEAHRTLAEAQDRIRDYARRFDDVQGYYLGNGFYGIVLGPYGEALARAELDRLRNSAQIPGDSYLQTGRPFAQQFWPIGSAKTVVVPRQDDPVALISALPQAPLTAPRETERDARASEAALPREAREKLQKALRWAGHYRSIIDGAFGPGTRRAMEDWQAINAQEITGVLTSRQRELLLEQYDAILVDVAMKLVRDDASGIQLQLPTAVVAFSEYRPPFVKFDGTSSLPRARVLLISQPGDTAKLRGLFEVLQVLDVVPSEGPRQLRDDSFYIEGIGGDIHSYTSVTLRDGQIKGFMLVWPDGDEARRRRILEEMQASFLPLDGVLDPNSVPARADQAVDMVSGLTVRQPRLSRSGFYVANDGTAVTTSDALGSCDRITLDRDTAAGVVAAFPDLGVAILRPLDPLSPLGIASFQTDIPRLQDKVVAAGYPFNGVLAAPTLTFGTLVDLRNLDGDDRVQRLSLETQPSNAGGPVFDESGAVLGLVLPRKGGTQSLPADVQFAVDAAQVVGLLTNAGVTAQTTGTAPALSSVVLADKAANTTALVSCW